MSQDDLFGLQRAIADEGYEWQAGPTTLSALTPEQQDRRLGLRIIPAEMERLAVARAELAPRAAIFPPAWDWRAVEGTDWTTPIRDQKGCGACVAFACVAVLEVMLKLHHNDAGLQPDLSEGHLFFCGCGECCDRGWWPSYALDYARQQGVPDEACFPYVDHDQPCSEACDDWQERATRVTEWHELIDVGQRKEWLANRGPVVGCMAVYRDFFNYVDGVYRHAVGELAGYHAICVVGYSEADQAWICKNSWGPNWGLDGWFKIGYGECDIDAQFPMFAVEGVVPAGPEPPPPPPPPPPPEPGCNLVQRILQALRGTQ
jgi:C1A family cysteine protease